VDRYGYYSQSEQRKIGSPPVERGLIREGFFAMELAKALKTGEVKSEAEAESQLTSIGIVPKNGWIADYPLTPDIIRELENAVGEAADSGKIEMDRDEAMEVFQDLKVDIEDQYAEVKPLPSWQPYPEEYYYPRFYYYSYPFFYPYPYYSFGYHRFHHPHHYPFSPSSEVANGFYFLKGRIGK
jgi:hypothetical protein